MSQVKDVQLPVSDELNGRRKFDIKKHMKNKWRQETFNKKLKLEKWEEKRQKAALRKYYRQMQKEEPGKEYVHPADKRRPKGKQTEANSPLFVKDEKPLEVLPENANRFAGVLLPQKQKKSAFKRALQAFEKQREEKEAKIKIAQQKMSEKKERLKMNKKQRTENFKKLSMKTARGQPVMSGRIHMLLDKIEKDLQRTTDKSN